MIITEEQREAFDQLFTEIYKGHDGAKDYSFMLLECFHIWDDSVDQDKPISKEDADKAWRQAMIRIPTHQMHHYFPEMPWLIQDVYFKWCAANEFESKGVHLEKAYILRAQLYGLFVNIAAKVVSFEHAVSISPLVWSFYGEDLETFKQEVKSCQTQ